MNTDFINYELSYWGKIYTDVTYAISDISPLMDESQLTKRKYYSELIILKDYIEKLNSAKSSNSKGFFSKIFRKDSSTDLLRYYKDNNKSSFNQLESCCKCACLTCIRDCKFKGCLNCNSKSHIKKCDKIKINIRVYNNFTLDLTNNNTGDSSNYKVLATLEDSIINKQYIVLQNIEDSDDKFILYYYPGISDDQFGEITDTDEFNLIVDTFEKCNF